MDILKTKRYIRRKKRVRANIVGNESRPRLSVFRSNKFIYAQVIDDIKGATLVAAKGLKSEAEKVGETLAKKAITKKIKKVVFDRNGFRFHGGVKNLAEGARRGGLQF